MKYINFIIFMSLLLTLNLSAKTYEDGEDKKISRWETLSPSSSATIKNVYDKSKGSRVIKFSGNGTKSAYILMINEKQNKKLFQWQMNYSEDFVIFVSLDTKLGKRYLIYTSGNKNSYMQYGLGTEAKSGTWQRYSRNLEDDLRYFDNRNSIVKINSFVIRGSGLVDNIKIMKKLNRKVREKIKKKPLKLKKKIVKPKKRIFKPKRKIVKPKKKIFKPKKKLLVSKKKPLKIMKKSNTDNTPTIIIEGENPYFLGLGEAFNEPGVSAKDKEDGEVAVTSNEYIDKHKDGKYIVIYMATDSNGNSAIDRRYVIVGEPNELDDSQKSNQNRKSEPVNESNEEVSDAQEQLDEQELEIAEWEKELQLREKELIKREKSMAK